MWLTVAVQSSGNYKLVELANGTHSIHSVAERETFHPVIGPVAEAEALYVRQLGLVRRLQPHAGEFVIWDVGLGAAANALTVLRAARDVTGMIRMVSFDRTLEPLEFALRHAGPLGYLTGYEEHLARLLTDDRVAFSDGGLAVNWELHLGDFPALLGSSTNTAPGAALPAPHAILFDAFSPAKNPAMWTQPLFESLFKRLEPGRPCVMPTYSRSTMLRVTLLLAGFFVGVGHATGEKEETTIAANARELIAEPLDQKWLRRANQSTSVEPMWEPVYRQAPLSAATRERLRKHPQFE